MPVGRKGIMKLALTRKEVRKAQMVGRKTNRKADRKKRCLASSGHTATGENPI
jgi:hypothetical protein